MSSPFPGQVTAFQVGSYFVGQYYPFLQQNPNLVHQFYTEVSTMIRFNGVENESATGTGEIHNVIINLNFTEIEIKTAHSLDSLDGGVLVMVEGLVQANHFVCRRKFVETFFLAPQEKGYFVLNDIFLLLEDEQQAAPPPAIEPLNHDEFDAIVDVDSPTQEPVSSYELEEDTPSPTKDSPPTSHPQENNPPENFSLSEEFSEEPYHAPDSEEIPDETPEEAPSSLFSNPPSSSFSNAPKSVQDPPPSELPLPVVDPPKHTYASILRASRAQAAPHLTTAPKMPPAVSEWHSVPQAIHQHVQSSFESFDEVSSFDDEGDSKSVYVGNIPASISASDLEHEFRNFGRIRPDGVTIRGRKEAGFFYAFIEFEDSIGVQNALKASPVHLHGKMIHVEGRRPNSGASRGGRRGRGRGGGYSSDSSRGRFVGRTFGRADERPTRGDGSSLSRGTPRHEKWAQEHY